MGMPQRKRGARILGPYPHGNGFRTIEIGEDGSRVRRFFETEEQAVIYKRLVEENLAAEDRTTETALDEYEGHLKAKGNKSKSIDRTRWSIGVFFPNPIPLWALTEKRCRELYADLATRNKHADNPEREPETYSVDSHRNALAEVKTFLAWCVEQRWISDNPAAAIKGLGKRRRGKPQLRIREARRWYAKAIEAADQGDDGAVASLVALLLGLRAGEIVALRVGDLDQVDEPADTIWVDRDPKTPASGRTLEVPEALQPYLVAAAKGRPPHAVLFPAKDGRPHWRDWVRKRVKKIAADAGLDAESVKALTAHSMRGMLADISLRRGAPGQLVADALGHEEQRTSRESYARPGAAEQGGRRRGLKVLSGGKGNDS